MAAALATIASHLVARVFTPVYLPTPNDGVRDLLLRYADADCQKEVTCRALLLSAYTADEQRKTVEIIVREVTGAVSEILANTAEFCHAGALPTHHDSPGGS